MHAMTKTHAAIATKDATDSATENALAYDAAQAADDYGRIAAAIRYLDAHQGSQPSLDAVAAHLHLSPWHFQRLFARWAGISPKRFVQFLTVDYARELLTRRSNVLDASLESGLSGPGRLHDLFVHVDAVTPGEFKNGGLGLTIRFGLHDSPFGRCLLAVTERGICGLSFVDEGAAAAEGAVAALRARWPAATLLRDPATTARMMAQIFPINALAEPKPVHLLLKGTNFQLKVWEALLRVPAGEVTTYEGVAQAIQRPTAARAVGSAVGANAIAYLIPCHRVIRKSGIVEGYRWGTVRKQAILGWEAGHADFEPALERQKPTPRTRRK